MMHLQKQTDQGLMVLGYFLSQPANMLASTLELSGELNISRPMVSKLTKRLCNKGLLTSVQGRQGGYGIHSDCMRLSIGEIIERLEGPIALTPCAQISMLEQCDTSRQCLISGHMQLINQIIRATLMAFPFRMFARSTKNLHIQSQIEHMIQNMFSKEGISVQKGDSPSLVQGLF